MRDWAQRVLQTQTSCVSWWFRLSGTHSWALSLLPHLILYPRGDQLGMVYKCFQKRIKTTQKWMARVVLKGSCLRDILAAAKIWGSYLVYLNDEIA